MDFFGVQLLVGIVLTVLIVFPGTVPPAYKRLLDGIVGRLIAVAAVIFATQMGGWPVGALAATAVLVLTPNTMREGFVGSEGFSLASQSSSPSVAPLREGFYNGGANKIQVVPKERRQRWFIEKAMNEKPRVLETDTAMTEAVQ